MTVVRIVTISGADVDGARWEIAQSTHLREKDKIVIHMAIPTGCRELLDRMSREPPQAKMLVMEDGKFSVTIYCEIREIRHMLDVRSRVNELETLITASPINRIVEDVMLKVLAATSISEKG